MVLSIRDSGMRINAMGKEGVSTMMVHYIKVIGKMMNEMDKVPFSLHLAIDTLECGRTIR